VAVLAVAFLILPIAGLLQRIPWSSLGDLLGGSAVADAVVISAIVSVCATAACIVLGLPLAWTLARLQFRGRAVVRSLVLLPMVLPPVVGGTALLFALGRRGLVGQWLDDWFGLSLPFTTAGAVVAATFVALPFFVVTVESALHQLDQQYEQTAGTLGASPWTTFLRVTLPMIRPAVVAGAALSWARALGEFGATITFAGDSPGNTRTLPLQIFVALETEPERALALSLVLVAVSLSVLVGLRGHWLGGSR
jgi:molybdate transport system permease protein